MVPLWGDGKLHSTAAAELELQCLAQFPDIIQTLNSLGLKTTKKSYLVMFRKDLRG
jgi:hypothetical protein